MHDNVPHLSDFSLENWILVPKSDSSRIAQWVSKNIEILTDFLRENSYIFELWEKSAVSDIYNSPNLRWEVLKFLQAGNTVRRVQIDTEELLKGYKKDALIGNWPKKEILFVTDNWLKSFTDVTLWAPLHKAVRESAI
jgi:hypothetical protein